MQPSSVVPVLGQVSLVPVLGIPFDVVDLSGALSRIQTMIASGRPHQVVTANLDFAAQAAKDVELRRIFAAAHLVVADGMPLVWAARRCGYPLPERVAGSDMVPLLLAQAAKLGWRVFFLGGTEESLARSAAVARQRFPGLQLVGTCSPPFGALDQMDHAGILSRIRAADPHVLFVGLGCPKQEKWIARHLHQLGVPVCMGVGASLDFIAEVVRRAPRWMQLSGTEWLYRVVQEPRRLFRRYWLDGWFFLRSLVASRFLCSAVSVPVPPLVSNHPPTFDCADVGQLTVPLLAYFLRFHRWHTSKGVMLHLINCSPGFLRQLRASGFGDVFVIGLQEGRL